MKCNIWKGLLPYTPAYRETIAIFLIGYWLVGSNVWEDSFSRLLHHISEKADIQWKEATSQKSQHILMTNSRLESMWHHSYPMTFFNHVYNIFHDSSLFRLSSCQVYFYNASSYFLNCQQVLRYKSIHELSSSETFRNIQYQKVWKCSKHKRMGEC